MGISGVHYGLVRRVYRQQFETNQWLGFQLCFRYPCKLSLAHRHVRCWPYTGSFESINRAMVITCRTFDGFRRSRLPLSTVLVPSSILNIFGALFGWDFLKGWSPG